MALDVNYSNGFDMNRVLTAMLNRLAWRQPSGSSGITLSDANKNPVSGRYFDGFHAISNVINIKNVMQEQPADDAAFDTFLQSLYKDTILRSLAGVFNAQELFDQPGMVYNRFSPGNDQVVDNSGKFVGYMIDVADKNSVSVQIHSVTALFTEDVTFNMYLFADGDPTILLTVSVAAVANTPAIIDVSNAIFGNKTKLSRARRYYFGYFQEDLLTAKAIAEQADFANTCMYAAAPVMLNCVDQKPLFNNYSTNWSPYGFNLEISSFRDHTDIIVRKAHLFDNLIGLQMAAEVIENIMFSNRSSGDERKMKENLDKLMVYMELKGTVPISDAPSTTGIAKEIERELVKLNKNFFQKPKSQLVNVDDLC